MKSILILIVSIFSAINLAYAQIDDSSCSQWERKGGVECIFAGKDAFAWQRSCENKELLCKYKQYSQCLKEKVCWTNDPNTLESACSEWVKNPGINCFNSGTGNWEQAWKRACTIGHIEETLCSDQL
jgi:hypothetical protein